MKSKIFKSILILSIALLNTNYAKADDFVYKPVNSGDVIESASELDYPPFSVVDKDGNADGYSVELLRATLNAVGLNVDFKVGPWEEVKNDLAVGNIRVLPLVGRTPEREEIFDFTVPYFSIEGAVYVRSDNNSIRDFEDLKNKELIELAGDNALEYIKREGITDNIYLVDTFPEAFEMLSRGEHDAVITSSFVGDQIVDDLNLSNIKRLDIHLVGFTQNFAFAVREDDKEMLEKLNEGLSIVITNGTREQLEAKWFPKIDSSSGVSLQELLIDILPYLIGVFLLILLFFVMLLRYQVKSRTSELESEVARTLQLKDELNKKNKELEDTLTDFYTMRIGMERDLELGKVAEENKKIKERIDSLKNEKY